LAGTTVLERLERGVLLLTLNRPERRNAFNNQMWCELRDALALAREDGAVRSVVVTGAGAAFTAGQDLAEMGVREIDGEREHGFASFMDELVGFDKPLLAAVNGVGVGIGLTLLLHCDVVHVGDEARLRVPFVTLGVVPEAASSYLLPLRIGWQHAAEVLFTAAWIDAARAVELGIALRRYPAEQLLPATLELAEAIARQPLGSLRHTKRLLQAHLQEGVRRAREGEDAGFRERVGSPENVEAIRAFFEKRPADFSKIPSE
jgi:enoyl-CoA hydratase/carnithine racemase